MSLELCIDPVDCAFPGLVNELLNQAPDTADRQISLAASITPQGFAYVLHARTLYIWNYSKKGKERLPHSYRLTLAPTGLKNSISAVALIHRNDDNALPSVIAVSPEGTLRYWANPSAPSAYLEKEIGIANDVVLSVVAFNQEDHVDRYLLSTTTGSFYIIDIFKERLPEMGNKAGNNIVTRQVTFTRPSLAERFTKVLFGTGEAKQNLVKTIVADRLFNDADIIAVYQSTIEFYSTKRNVVTETIDVADYILRDLLETEVTLNPSEAGISFDRLNETTKLIRRKRSVYVADAIPHNGGLLLLVGAAKPGQRTLTFAQVHLTPESVNAKSTNWIDMLALSEQYGIPESPQVRASLYTPSKGNFVIVFPSMVVSLENIENPNDGPRICDISKFTDQLIGSACVGAFVQVIMKRSGICNVRHLPRGFDTTFWQKFGAQFEPVVPNPTTVVEAVTKVFTLFASKNLPEARAAYNDLNVKFPDKSQVAETIVTLTKKMLDAKPMTDPRWNKDAPVPTSKAETHRSTNVLTHVEDKLAYYKMIVMFLRYFGYMDTLNTPMQAFSGRSPLAVMVEFGEKVYAMSVIMPMTHELLCPTIDSAIHELGAEIQRNLAMTDNQFLKAKDYFAKEVTSFAALVPTVLKKQQRDIEEKGALTGNVLKEVSQMFVAIIESTMFYMKEDWTIKPGPDDQVLTNNPEFLTHFNRQFNLIFDYLESKRVLGETAKAYLNPASTIGRFVLSKQSRIQRNNSAIIQRFYRYGDVDVALRLAEEYLDFSTLIQHCCRALPDIERRYQLEKYKTQFKSEEFDLYLYEYYKEHGLITDLLEQRGDRVEHFLSKHHEINWIRNVEKKEYGNAKTALKTIANGAPSAKRKKTVLALAKLAALCEDEVDHEEVAQITNGITLLEHQEAINPDVLKTINPTNAPLTLEGIVNANLSGGDKEGFLRALIALTTVVETREYSTELGLESFDKLRTRIWSTIIEADAWPKALKKSPITLQEDFDKRVSDFYEDSKLGQVLHQLCIYDLPNTLKKQLLPQSMTPLKNLFTFNEAWAQTEFANIIDNAFGEARRYLDSEVENVPA